MYTHEPGAAFILVPLGATLRAQFSKGQAKVYTQAQTCIFQIFNESLLATDLGKKQRRHENEARNRRHSSAEKTQQRLLWSSLFSRLEKTILHTHTTATHAAT